jgi:hypothetical protein
MIKIDFEFISTHRNRNLWPNPCLFEVPWSGNGQSTGLNAFDPISNQIPIVQWISQNISITGTVVAQTTNNIIVSAPLNSFSKVQDYYSGAEIIVPLPSNLVGRVNGSKFIGQNGGLDYLQITTENFKTNIIGTNPVIKTTQIPNALFVPNGSDLANSYVGKYLYNETKGESILITSYDSDFHRVIGAIPPIWNTTSDAFSIRNQLPTVGNFSLLFPTTTTNINLTGVGVQFVPGDYIRILATGEIVKIVGINGSLVTVSPQLSASFPVGTKVEICAQTSDNYKTLSYAGTTVGQHEQKAYDINLVSATIPNLLIKNGNGGYPSDYPFLYVELYDTNHPSQNSLFSNNHSNKSYFKVTTPTGQLVDRNEKFTKYTGDLSFKTIRFRPTSNFRVSWRLPSGEIIEFEKDDTISPYIPDDKLQTSTKFNLRRD